MASVASPQLPTQPRSPSASAPTSREALNWLRVAGYLLAAFPLIGLAVWAHSRGFESAQLALIEHRAGLVRAGGPSLKGLRYGYPPLPALVALVLPGGPLSLSIVTCVFSSVILGYVTTRLLGRVSAVVVVALVLPIVADPTMWYAESQFLGPVSALAFLAIALDGFVRFAAHGETEGGFAAGIALALSLCCDPGALMYGLVMCAFAPLISHARYNSRYSAAAIAAVLSFPVAAAAAGWLFLVWKFSGAFPGSLDYQPGVHLLAFPGGIARSLAAAARAAGWDLLHVPLYFAAAAMLWYRRPAALAGLLLPIVALTSALWLGFIYSQAASYLMLTILALVVISETGPRRFQTALAVVALVQLALALAWPPASTSFATWAHLVF
jgi:hypothetical protein